MKRLLTLIAFIMLASSPAMAQYVITRVEVGGGYTFRSLDVPGSSRVNMNGWDVNGAFNFNKWIAVAADGDGTYNGTPDEEGGTDKTTVYSFQAGPRLYPIGHHRFTPYAQALFGYAHVNLSFPAADEIPMLTENCFAWSVGGGLDANVTRHIAIRLGEFDYEQFHSSLLNGFEPGPHQNNFKYKAGVVIRF
jgi:opacity protein-like surface antigen